MTLVTFPTLICDDLKLSARSRSRGSPNSPSENETPQSPMAIGKRLRLMFPV